MAKIFDKDLGWERIKREMRLMKDSHVKIGVLQNAGEHKESGVHLADIATWNEFGDKRGRIPSRPFMRQTFDKNLEKVHQFLRVKQDEIYRGKGTTKGTLKEVGTYMQGRVQEMFIIGNFKPNAPSTIERKNRELIKKAETTIRAANRSKKELSPKRLQRVAEAKQTLAGPNTTPLIDTGRLRQSINFEVVLK